MTHTLENMETLWLLHWFLLSKPCNLPVWWLIMNKFSAGNVSDLRMSGAM